MTVSISGDTGIDKVQDASIVLADLASEVYQTGTWTPTDQSGASLSFSSAAGTYTKIGNRVLFSFTVTYPTTTNPSQAIISLPIACATVSPDGYQGGGALRYTTYNGYMWFPIMSGQAKILVFTANGVDLTNANLSTKRIDVWGEYMAA